MAPSGNRQFGTDGPNQVWVSDFTYVSTWQGRLYVAFVVEVFARRIVGWCMSRSMVHSARLNGHDSHEDLRDVLQRPPSQPASRVDELLPHRWQPPSAAA